MRAKFICEDVNRVYDSFEEVQLRAVYSEDSNTEDNQFSSATPNGTLHMTISNPTALGYFQVGQKYYLDFTPSNN